MAKTIDIELQRQLDKPQTWFCKYYPARIRNVGEKEIADRQLVFDFKDGRAYEEVAQRTAERLLALYGKDCMNIVFFQYRHHPVRRMKSATKHSVKGFAN